MKALLLLVAAATIGGCDSQCAAAGQSCEGNRVVTCLPGRPGAGFERRIFQCEGINPVCVTNGQEAQCAVSASPCVSGETCAGSIRTVCHRLDPPAGSDASPQGYRRAWDCSASRSDGGAAFVCAPGPDGSIGCAPPPP